MWWRLKRAALITVFLHEQYHHKIESFSIRLAVAEHRSFYPDYSTRLVSYSYQDEHDVSKTGYGTMAQIIARGWRPCYASSC